MDGAGGEDQGAALDAQGVGALADVGQVDAAAFHSGDLGGAVGELPQLNGDALLLEGAGVHGGQDAPQGGIVGHVGDTQGDGLDLGVCTGVDRSVGRIGLAASAGIRAGAGPAVIVAARNQRKDHGECKQHRCELLHFSSS